jgi:hypothetical protein
MPQHPVLERAAPAPQIVEPASDGVIARLGAQGLDLLLELGQRPLQVSALGVDRLQGAEERALLLPQALVLSVQAICARALAHPAPPRSISLQC